MILGDREINKYIKSKKIVVTPLLEKVEGSSLDLHIEGCIKIPIGCENIIDTKDEKTYPRHIVNFRTYFDIAPKQFVLGSTIETIKIPNNISAFVQGRSSWARLGLAVEIAGFIDAGFEGQITLEIFNMSNHTIRIYKNQKICQIIFVKMVSSPKVSYEKKKSQKYMNQKLPTLSKLFLDK